METETGKGRKSQSDLVSRLHAKEANKLCFSGWFLSKEGELHLIIPRLLSPSEPVCSLTWCLPVTTASPLCFLSTAAAGCACMTPEAGRQAGRRLHLHWRLPVTSCLEKRFSVLHEYIKKTENILFVNRKRLSFLGFCFFDFLVINIQACVG